ncbi:unnamed protein product [Cylicocyclus nassatus]|uniref:Uncharacterized protein n=1 Tax=Cylicocyclus nassatus TaxID=53992 RepID=A0AA36MD12_CYLNA|nr:unnamed protein product [Cylicocyclus nassatus]
MRAWMLTLFVLMLAAAMCFTMAEPVPVNAAEADSDVSSIVRQKRQFLYGYPSYRTYTYYYAHPSYSYYPSYFVWY